MEKRPILISAPKKPFAISPRPEPTIYDVADVHCHGGGNCPNPLMYRLITLFDDQPVIQDGETLPSTFAYAGFYCEQHARQGVEEALGLIEEGEGAVKRGYLENGPAIGVMLLPFHMKAEHIADICAELTPEVRTGDTWPYHLFDRPSEDEVYTPPTDVDSEDEEN